MIGVNAYFGFPVVPELNKIHSGQLNDVLCHAISPDASVADMLARPAAKKSSQGVHPLSSGAPTAPAGMRTTTTRGGARMPASSVRSFPRCACTLPLYLRGGRPHTRGARQRAMSRGTAAIGGAHDGVDAEYHARLHLLEATSACVRVHACAGGRRR